MPETSDPHDLDSLAEDFISRRRQGERASIEEYAALYPELAEEILELFPTMLELEQLKLHKTLSSGGAPASIGPAPVSQLGDFRIVREVGRGGMGVVYEAEQQSLHRRVALKVLGTQIGMTTRQKARFRREASAAAKLHHTNIVPIYGVGEDQGLQFYAMQFIDGVPLNRMIRTWREAQSLARSESSASPSQAGFLSLAGAVKQILRAQAGHSSAPDEHPTVTDGADDSATYPSPLMAVSIHEHSDSAGTPRVVVQSAARELTTPPAAVQPPGKTSESRNKRSFWNEVSRIVIDVASALEHAHHHGILHRDVKPANLLLDFTGTIWVTDFGLAKMESQDHTLTRSGDFIGTLRYVAPEQLHGQADARSDVYSLGLTLFELLTLQPAFEDEPLAQILQRRVRELPKKPRAINPLIPKDLEIITLKACAADPAHRYQSAAEFAADLRRFVEDRPIHARSVTLFEQFYRWSRKNPVVAGLGTVSALLLLTLITVLGVANYKIGKSADLLALESQSARDSAQIALSKRKLADDNLKLAIQAFEDIMDNVASRGSPVSLVSEEDVPTIGETTEVSPADAKLLGRLLEFFDRFAQQNSTDFTQEMADIRSRIGDIQVRLGRTAEAEESYKASAQTYLTLRESRPSSLPLLLAHAKIWNRLGVAYSQSGRVVEAFEAHHHACQLLEENTIDKDSLEVQLEIGQSLILADTVFIRSGASEVMAEMFRDRGNRPPPPPEGIGPLSRPRENEPGQIERPPRENDGRGNPRDSDRGGRSAWRRPINDWDKGSIRAVALLEKLWAEHPDHTQIRLLLASAHRNRYYANRVRHMYDQANVDLQIAIDHMTALGELDRNSPTYRFELADLLCLPIASSSPESLNEESISRLERSIAISEKLLSETPTIPEYQAILGLALRRLASIHQSANKLELADAEYRRAIEIQRPLAVRYPSTSVYQVAYVKSLAGLADLNKLRENYPEAKEALDRAIVVLQDFLDKHEDDRVLRLSSYKKRLQERRDKIAEKLSKPSSEPLDMPAT
jgi:serine/threonine protein kinase